MRLLSNKENSTNGVIVKHYATWQSRSFQIEVNLASYAYHSVSLSINKSLSASVCLSVSLSCALSFSSLSLYFSLKMGIIFKKLDFKNEIVRNHV